ncbi:RagB/SusD family nutrient uptake outer membrane protein [Kaistella sp. BT6-1-3]|uniref:RagB/SusD family nutrient uptake outer membrane protein n=1 Tax=Kaistella yananensis TaxID=2989820 RepID=A0ABT3JMB6_9FLAO|nr:RagB/SusD family nutrient uptake outer membrane protein [Kaistella yananensis]MCW4451907.1 RagB/SusD family nutrient uptake outer membrane protein [Kaistella yananensis]
MNKTIKIGLLSIALAFTANSCSDDFVKREFYQEVEQAPLTTLNEVKAFVKGGYVSLRANTYYGADFLAYGEVRSDEMISNLAGGYYQNVMNYTMLSSDAYATNTYTQIYTLIAKANILINTDMSTIQGSNLDRQEARYAQGQAYAMRALGFFDAHRLYGQKYTGGTLGIVLPLKYDPKAMMPRATIAETEAQIESDFNKALELMTANGSVNNVTKTEFTINSVKGLASRFYLYKGDYAKVRTYTNDIVSSGKYTVPAASLLQETFRFSLNGAAPNSIFELAVGINASLSTNSYRQRLNPNGYGNIVVNASTLAAYAPTDVRRTFITTSGGQRYLSFNSNANGIGKYTQGVGADNIKMLRYEEILLNGVEAELNGGDPAKALNYYNMIVTNRGLPAATSVDMTMLKVERMKELLGEGLRQWDLRRWGDAVPRPAGASTDVNLNAFPIPRSETDLANSPIIANPGYDN